MPDTKLSKAHLRSTLRQRRQQLSHAQQLIAARAIARSVAGLAQWPQAQRIALYMAADGEIDTSALAELGRGLNKQLYLPVIQADKTLCFALWQRQGSLSVNCYGIPEPSSPASQCPVGSLDILFLPVVGWDRCGARLGMGGGFYDRTLSGTRGPLLVGLAHASQEIHRVPLEDWDIALDIIATDHGLHHCQEAG